MSVVEIDDRFELEWQTDITDSYGTGEKKRVRGKLILTADTIFSAAEIAGEILCDVDFFYPNQTFSASTPNVLSGRLTIGGEWYTDLEHAWPELTEADFERVDILGIRKLEPGTNL